MVAIGKVWNWFGKNSGQIQVIIALIALGLAVLGYYKILDQMDLSAKQVVISDKEKEQVLKVNSMNLLLDMMYKNMSAIQGNNRILKELKNIDLNNKSKEESEYITQYIQLLEKKNEKIVGMKKLITEWARSINNNEPLNSDKQTNDMKIIYEALIVINEEIVENDDILSSLKE